MCKLCFEYNILVSYIFSSFRNPLQVIYLFETVIHRYTFKTEGKSLRVYFEGIIKCGSIQTNISINIT